MACALSSADRAFAARLEAAEAANGKDMVRALASYLPEACWEAFAGGASIFAGVGSAMTQVLGLGMSGAISQEDFDRAEAFYRERGSACVIDLCPLADVSVMAYLEKRPYRVVEFTNVLARRILPDQKFENVGVLRRVQDGEMWEWSRSVSSGFSENMPVADETEKLMGETCRNAQCWFAGGLAGDEPSGGAAMSVQNGVALLFGDAVRVNARRQGWQSALIRERLAAAQQQGCDAAMVSVMPGSASHRNYERAGFELMYMRISLQRDFSETPPTLNEP